MVKTRQIMPILVVLIAMSFHAIDVFSEYDITTEQLVIIDGFLAPFGLGGIIRAGHKTYLASRINSTAINPEDIVKLKELLAKITS